MIYLKVILVTAWVSLSAFAQVPEEFNPFQKGIKLEAAYDEGGGVQGGGGGDLVTERRIKEIRDDIYRWIALGGAADFDYQSRLTRNEYEHGNKLKHTYGMKEVLRRGAVVVNVILRSDQDLKNELKNTFVNGARKICKGVFEAKTDHRAYIICEKESFQQMDPNTRRNEDLQYQQIHHEYASLARIEKNVGSDSDYFLSVQIKSFISSEVIRRLRVGHMHQHKEMQFVPIGLGLEMQTTPVTQGQWVSMMGYNRSLFRDWMVCEGKHSTELGGYCFDLPVENVTFTEICGSNDENHPGDDIDYNGDPMACGKYNGFAYQMNALNDGCEYRLPTEEEWDRGLRAGTKTKFFWGDDPADVASYAWINEPSETTGRAWVNGKVVQEASGCTHEVGTKKPNAFGLFDMVGNVAEWVFDFENPQRPSSRVVKGAPFSGKTEHAKVGERDFFEGTQHRSPMIGFRLVRSCKIK